MESLRESIMKRAKHKLDKDRRVNDRMMQPKERKDNLSNALDADLVVTESNETKSERHVLSNRSRNDTHTDDADINSVDRNTNPESTDMSHRGGEIDQNADAKKFENADLKAQIQEKVFANVALKNELRKLKGNNVDTKFAKPSILGKPVLQPPRNQSVVRQLNAFKSERPNFSKPRFASQVDVNNVLSKPVTPHYLPKVRESASAKPNHGKLRKKKQDKNRNLIPREMPSAKTHHTPNACTPKPRSNNQTSRNWPASKSCEEMLKAVQKADHSRNPKEAKKKTQDKNRNLKPREMPSAKTHYTPNACTPKPRSNSQTYKNWLTSKSCEEMLKAGQKADHSRNPSLFSDSIYFVCSTCQKCVFNANHDACITKLLKEVNSCVKIQSTKTRNSNNPVDPISHTQKPGRKIVTGHSFSPSKSSAVYEKTNTPRSYLRWIPTGRIFNTVGLNCVSTGKTFTSSTTMVDCEPPNGSKEYITNPYKCDQTLNVSAGTLNLSTGTFCNLKKERLGVYLLKRVIYQKPRVPGINV
nr:hypothetical protein [Tanacetum cinerariifolium]